MLTREKRRGEEGCTYQTFSFFAWGGGAASLIFCSNEFLRLLADMLLWLLLMYAVVVE